MGMLGLSAAPASAQACTPRTDWATYRVAPGDTLFRIAVRYNLTTTTLASANCITNINLIYVGQILRVPTDTSGIITGLYNIGVTFQQFEKGFMIWRPDSGDIWVYVGQTGGKVWHFLSTAYGRLPDNPVQLVTPSGKVRPILGFGKVWGNYAYVRNALGWATAHELVYISEYRPVTTSQFYFTLPDGHTVLSNYNLTWSIYTGNPPPAPPAPTAPPTSTSVTTSAAYQLFENGFLIWRADTGRIDAFTKDYSVGFDLNQYAYLPDNPVTDVPPPNRVKPMFGFGKVWGNDTALRNALGWALGFEQAYQATFVTAANSYVSCVNLPDGHFVSYPHFVQPRNWVWQYETSCSG